MGDKPELRQMVARSVSLESHVTRFDPVIASNPYSVRSGWRNAVLRGIVRRRLDFVSFWEVFVYIQMFVVIFSRIRSGRGITDNGGAYSGLGHARLARPRRSAT